MKRTQESTVGVAPASKKVHRDSGASGAVKHMASQPAKQAAAQPAAPAAPCIAAGSVTPASMAGWSYPPLPMGMMAAPFCFPGMPSPFFNPVMSPFWMPAVAAAAGMMMPGAVMGQQAFAMPSAAMPGAPAPAPGAAMYAAACGAQPQMQYQPQLQQPQQVQPQTSGSSFCVPAAAPSMSCGSLQSDACAKPASCALKAWASDGGSPSVDTGSTSNDANDEEFSFFIDNFLGADAPAGDALDLGLSSDSCTAITRVDSIFDFFEQPADDAFVTL